MSRSIRPALAGIIAALLAAPAASADKTKAEQSFGPPPAWQEYRALAEADVRARLLDPESARVTWTRGYFQGEYKPFLASRVRGYVACGYVNAKNRMGGYTGATSFITVIDHGRVLYAEIDRSPVGMISQGCAKAVSAGSFPPLPEGAARDTASGAPLAPAASASSAGTLTRAVSGLTLRAMPDGAYVSAVAAGSRAEAASLKPGMVIASVNGIPLAGMGDAMLKVVDAAGTGASLTIVGGTNVKLGTRP